ncbi:hypothetical protein GCM10010106_15840 [Thermopolyspora flexuosa]|jgi:hypothetical protein|uniref:Uncharacterized protein n=1 Tax=Thermopolyspora flexuosa TaxID=103836 RepID=A0A543IPH1_9ACTN|nr:hypothetical protein [Thermopolyspora flexuosa]TQM72461.1 hypothetical protein FHX40_4601 [Thermopolyspora flexuosa]GGM70509.1 hypothetical protein GCM10010106_15840 [Thermopolyspora flexuosa]
MGPLAPFADLVAGSPGLVTLTAFGLIGVTLLMPASAAGLVAGMPRSAALA